MIRYFEDERIVNKFLRTRILNIEYDTGNEFNFPHTFERVVTIQDIAGAAC